jgi:quercetin dioxygenase-like cupin family protein
MDVKKQREIVTTRAPGKNINGNAWINHLVNAQAGCTVASVTFEAAARTHWHYHPTVQILIGEKGSGFVQQRGGNKQLIKPGDVVVIYPGEVHWHGATPGSMFSHTATQLVKDEGIIECEVTENEYLSDTDR